MSPAKAFAFLTLAALACGILPARGQSSLASPLGSNPYELDISASKQWVDTNIDLRAGEKLRLTAAGTITYPAPQSSNSQSPTPRSFGPDGLARSFRDLLHEYACRTPGTEP